MQSYLIIDSTIVDHLCFDSLSFGSYDLAHQESCNPMTSGTRPKGGAFRSYIQYLIRTTKYFPGSIC